MNGLITDFKSLYNTQEVKKIIRLENKLMVRMLIGLDCLVILLNYFLIFINGSQNLMDRGAHSLVYIPIGLIQLIIYLQVKNEVVKARLLNLTISVSLFLFAILFINDIYFGVLVPFLIFMFIGILYVEDSLLYFVNISLLLTIINFLLIKQVLILQTGYYFIIYSLFFIMFALSVLVRRINSNRLKAILNANEELEQIKQNYINIFNGSTDPILIEKDNIFIDCNDAVLEYWGYSSKSDVIGLTPNDISASKQLDGDAKELILKHKEDLKKSKSIKFEWVIQDNNKKEKLFELILTNMILENQKVIHILCRDISERKILEEKLQYLSVHDALTGLYNRRYFEIEMERLNKSRYLPISIVVCDINNLKKVNDTFGHGCGDKMIQAFAEVLNQSCRQGDIIVRLGGDEFALLLPGTQEADAIELVKRIDSNCMDKKFDSIQISAAMGVATKQSSSEDLFKILNIADNNMYKIKKNSH